MARFFLKIAGDSAPYPLTVDLPNIATLRREAVRTACASIQSTADQFWSNGGDWHMTVTDERGLTIFSLTFFATDAPASAGR